MSVDEKIDDIRLTIAAIHRGLYKFDKHLDGVLSGLNETLTSLDQQLNNAEYEVGRLREDANTVLNYVRTIFNTTDFYLLIFQQYKTGVQRNRKKKTFFSFLFQPLFLCLLKMFN